MRIDVKKFLMLGSQDDRARFFNKAQEAGIIHFIDINPGHVKELSSKANDVLQAIKILRGLPLVEQEENEDFEAAGEITDRILSLKTETEFLEEKIRMLNLDISRIAGFGRFNLEDIAYIEKEGKCKFQFFCAKENSMDPTALEGSVFFIHSEHGLDYFLAINPHARMYERMVEMKIERSLDELRKDLHETEQKLHLFDKELKGCAKYNSFLHKAFIQILNKENLVVAHDYAQNTLEGALFAVEGWVPINKVADLYKIVEDIPIYIEEIAIETKDSIPTYLENTGLNRMGEDLIHIYDVPSSKDKDPSLWVLFAFAFFFAMIVGDGGYGLIFLGMALYIRYRIRPKGEVKKRVVSIFALLGVACVIWGVLTNSFFGIPIGLESPLRKVSVLNWMVEKKVAYHIKTHDKEYDRLVATYPNLKGVEDPKEFIKGAVKVEKGHETHEILESYANSIMFELALYVGALHLMLSFTRYLDRNKSGLGWILFLIGGCMAVPYFLNAPSLIHYIFGIPLEKGGQVGSYLLVIGLCLAVVLAVYQHKLLGLIEIAAVIQIFADVLSYLRLYALGLAGAIVAATVNDITAGLPFILALLIMIPAHLVNMLLSVMGGVIHGLRLNFLEWYRYSFEGGGKAFKPLKFLDWNA